MNERARKSSISRCRFQGSQKNGSQEASRWGRDYKEGIGCKKRQFDFLLAIDLGMVWVERSYM